MYAIAGMAIAYFSLQYSSDYHAREKSLIITNFIQHQAEKDNLRVGVVIKELGDDYFLDRIVCEKEKQ